jgi:hypothetical protein
MVLAAQPVAGKIEESERRISLGRLGNSGSI